MVVLLSMPGNRHKYKPSQLIVLLSMPGDRQLLGGMLPLPVHITMHIDGGLHFHDGVHFHSYPGGKGEAGKGKGKGKPGKGKYSDPGSADEISESELCHCDHFAYLQSLLQLKGKGKGKGKTGKGEEDDSSPEPAPAPAAASDDCPWPAPTPAASSSSQAKTPPISWPVQTGPPAAKAPPPLPPDEPSETRYREQ